MHTSTLSTQSTPPLAMSDYCNSGGNVRFGNRSEPEPNARSAFRFSECLNLNARFGSAFGGDQARSNPQHKIEPEQ
jgi:hypothetical protein